MFSLLPPSGPRRTFYAFPLSGLLLASALLGSCKKSEPVEPKLPAATEQGLNTAGCRVDGKRWVAVGGGLFSPPPTGVNYLRNGSRRTLSILLSKMDSNKEVHSGTSISLFVPDIRTAGRYDLNQAADPALSSTNPPYARFYFGRVQPPRTFLTGPAAGGRLIITRLDTISRIVAGTFEFTATEQGQAAQVRVSEGRFDLKY